MTMMALLLSSVALAGPPPFLEGGARGLGVGIVAGDPSGLSLAYRPPDSNAYLQAAAGWSMSEENFSFNGDYLYTVTTFASPEDPALTFPVYIGAGARARLGEDSAVSEFGRASSLGLRLPVGVAFTPQTVAVDVFMELAPTLLILPETKIKLSAGLGVRVYPFRKIVRIDM